jgi:hypothetical protein
VEEGHVTQLLPNADPSHLPLLLRAMEDLDLLHRQGSACVFPAIPLALHEQLYPFPIGASGLPAEEHQRGTVGVVEEVL